MFNLPEVGDTVTVTITGQVKEVVPVKDEEGNLDFQIYVESPDGETYFVSVPSSGVHISIPPKTNYYTYNVPCNTGGTANFFWKNG
jgi:hypothetical protein